MNCSPEVSKREKNFQTYFLPLILEKTRKIKFLFQLFLQQKQKTDYSDKVTWVRVVASAMTKGTFTNLAKVLASRVFPVRDESKVRIP
jgi:hypothetical protein